ncbi:response regulator [Cohnella cellulosilytica]|uniref:Response regulator n=1 Tax=Cohnella cellulosilytica TaxID=986710 RepID=A0ABW2FIB1_9BACL
MIRVMLIDDEEDALDLLEILLGQIGDVQIAGRYLNPLQAIEDLGRISVDAVFLDNQMPGMKGMEAARKIRSRVPRMPIVFTTAYAEYAVEAFEIQSTDYLLKPFTQDRLRKSVARIRQQILPEPVVQGPASAGFPPAVRCLGGFHIDLPGSGNKVLTWKTKKEKELCAFLIHHAGKAVHTAAIIEALWPEHDLNKAKTYLYTCLSYLRRSLTEHRLPIRILKADQGFVAVMDGATVDVTEFERQLAKARAADEMDVGLFDNLKRLYEGEYMEACDFGWAAPRQLELKADYARALRKGYAHFRSRGNLALAADSLQSLLSLVPDSEIDGRELIQLHLKTGNRNEALRVCRQLEQAVRVQLGAELEEETLLLIRQTKEKTERQA